MAKTTTNGSNGGVLKGDSHQKPSGGIPTVIESQGGRPVKLEGGEVIINKHAAKKHWKDLDKINQSTGGAPIHEPQFGAGGNSGCGCSHSNKDMYDDGGNTDSGPKAGNGKSKAMGEEGSSTGTGKLYEFFTPLEVTEKMWALLYHYGFKAGSILDPAIGSGRLLHYAPQGSTVTGFEISPDNFSLVKNELESAGKFKSIEIYNLPFETAFMQPERYNSLYKNKKQPTWLKDYPFDLVVANPPYGKFTGLYKTYFKFSGQFEHFFILKSMELVRPGGLGAFIIPSSFMRNGNTYNGVKEDIFKTCSLLDAYRLPNNIFKKTQIGTDLIILKKGKK